MSLRRPLQRSFLSPVRPSRHLNSFFGLLPPSSSSSSSSLPFLYPSRSFSYRSNNDDYDPEQITNYDDETEVPFKSDLLPRLPPSSHGPSQKVALKITDPWAFLQGTSQKPPTTHQVPLFREIPKTGAFPSRLSAQFADQRTLLRDQDGMSGTLTEREREIFTRIFETILSERSSFSPRVPPMSSHPSTSLNALLESAVGPQQSGSEISFGPSDLINKASATTSLALASSSEELPAALRAAAAKAAGLIRPYQKEMQERLDLQRSTSIVGLVEDLNLCNTDLALGQWMEDHVFCFVKNGRLEMGPPEYPPGSYAYLLAEGMKILRITFNDFAGSLAIFERIKKLGAESYVLGCSVDVYNQAIAAKWEAYRDLYKIKDMVDEMDINGIQGNDKTVRLMQDIMDDVSAMDYSQKNSVAHAMIMEGNAGVVSHLNYKADAWNASEKGGDSLEKSLSRLLK